MVSKFFFKSCEVDISPFVDLKFVQWFSGADGTRWCTVWKVSRYGVFSGPNTRKYGPEKTPYLDNFHGVGCVWFYH